jgi:hypothetical protein
MDGIKELVRESNKIGVAGLTRAEYQVRLPMLPASPLVWPRKAAALDIALLLRLSYIFNFSKSLARGRTVGYAGVQQTGDSSWRLGVAAWWLRHERSANSAVAAAVGAEPCGRSQRALVVGGYQGRQSGDHAGPAAGAGVRKVALGSSGAGLKFARGDNKTPLGVFRVGWINDHSRFKKFIGLDYPNLDYAEQALREHRIDRLTYERIRAAWVNGRTPPQDTPLGGQIGIHGIGFGDPSVHSAGINWTSGCVALDNGQIDALRPWVRVGMRVEIR